MDLYIGEGPGYLVVMMATAIYFVGYLITFLYKEREAGNLIVDGKLSLRSAGTTAAISAAFTVFFFILIGFVTAFNDEAPCGDYECVTTWELMAEIIIKVHGLALAAVVCWMLWYGARAIWRVIARLGGIVARKAKKAYAVLSPHIPVRW